MKLSKSSVLSKLYCWFYVTNKLPISLCPYFWRTVLMFILFVPYCIVSLPVIIGSIFCKDFRVEIDIRDYHRTSIESPWSRVGFGVMIYVLILFFSIVLLPLLPLFIDIVPKSKLSHFITAMGIIDISGVVLFIFCIFYSFISDYFRERQMNNLIVKEKTSNIIVEMVKAKYKKYCPKIDWID